MGDHGPAAGGYGAAGEAGLGEIPGVDQGDIELGEIAYVARNKDHFVDNCGGCQKCVGEMASLNVPKAAALAGDIKANREYSFAVAR